MDYSRLKNNIMEVIREEQIKLGYRSETVRLYYPLSSLNRCLSCELDTAGMQEALREFAQFVKGQLGEVEVSNRGERFCFSIPPQGVDYVHDHLENVGFLQGFIRTVEKRGCTIEDILQQFYKYSDKVYAKSLDNGEFDWLIYFEDGKPDDFRYCLKDEGYHMIYHRFTVEDYNDLGF